MNPSDDGCLQCRNNFQFNLNEKVCKYTDPNCINLGPSQCLQCSTSSYLNLNGRCTPLPPNCVSADPTGQCIQCQSGFNRIGSSCVFQQNFNAGSANNPTNNNINTNANTNANTNVNTNVNTNTNFFNTNSNTNVVINNQQNNQNPDPNCLEYNDASKFCVKCSTNFYVYNDGKCVPTNPLCK